MQGIEVQVFTPNQSYYSPNGTHLSAVTSAVLNDAAMVKLLFERRNEFDFDVSHSDLNIAAFQHRGLEVFEIILEWLMEKGVPVDQEYGSRNVLHHACQYNSEAALFLLQTYEKFGIERSAVVSMTNLADAENKRPIDLAKESIWVDEFTERLIQELENFV